MNELNPQTSPKQLSDLMLGLGVYSKDITITHLCDDTRKLQAGDTFLCLPRVQNKRALVQQAIDKQAASVIFVGEAEQGLDIVCACLPDMQAAGTLLRRWFETEQTSVQCIGITGTDGKTSTAWMLREILEKYHGSAWSVGTLGWMKAADNLMDLGNTTPSLFNNHRLLALAQQQDIAALVFEVSSHGIAQQRIAGLPFAAAIWTTMGYDHLEDHGGFENYLSLKSSFMQSVLQAGGAVVANADYEHIRAALSQADDVFWYGAKKADLSWAVEGQSVVMTTNQEKVTFHNVSVADFHAENLAAVAGVMHALYAISLHEFAEYAQGVSTPLGRLEAVGEQVYIDYAHTAEGLQRCLLSARKLTQDKLLLVFGCGGNRDKSKRPVMGAVAETYADECWLTSDNPRDEQQQDIAADVLAGIKHAEAIHVVEDRALAITQAVNALANQDVLVIAGKGHESYLEVAGKRLPWSDKDVAEQALAEVQLCA